MTDWVQIKGDKTVCVRSKVSYFSGVLGGPCDASIRSYGNVSGKGIQVTGRGVDSEVQGTSG